MGNFSIRDYASVYIHKATNGNIPTTVLTRLKEKVKNIKNLESVPNVILDSMKKNYRQPRGREIKK